LNCCRDRRRAAVAARRARWHPGPQADSGAVSRCGPDRFYAAAGLDHDDSVPGGSSESSLRWITGPAGTEGALANFGHFKLHFKRFELEF
jgi:hypothetical protein